MNVTLNLVTDFQDIPKEVSHMLKYVQDELQSASKSTANISDKMKRKSPDHQEGMELLHALRLELAKIDSRMEDCMSILAGYIHYLENPPEEQAEEAVEEEQDEEG